MQFDLETFTYDEEWLRSVAQLEDACDEIGAGIEGVALGPLLENPTGYSIVITAQMLVLRVWKDWVNEWPLGIGIPAAHRKGRQLLLDRLKMAKSPVQERLLDIAEEKHRYPQDEWQFTNATQQTIRQIIEEVLTQADWQAIAASACDRIHAQVMAYQSKAMSA